MTETCNGWDNYATWRVNVEYGDLIEKLAEDAFLISNFLRDHIMEISGIEAMESGMARDLLVNSMCSVSWDCLVDHYQAKPWEKM